MSTKQLSKFKLKVTNLGPVFEREGELSRNAKNFIFARNGTGKSFLSRALRCFDLYQQSRDLAGTPFQGLVAWIPALLLGCGFPNLLDIADAV